MTKTNTQINIVDQIKLLNNTSAKIRAAVQYAIDSNSTKPIADAEKILWKADVRTKDGAPIRYQYVRNIWNQHISK